MFEFGTMSLGRHVVQAPVMTMQSAMAMGFSLAADRLSSAKVDDTFLNPAAWARENIDWPEDEAPTPYQEAVWFNLGTLGRECVRGPHGLGKTALAAIAILWFADTREKAHIDWKVVSTASVWRQLEKYLWPEIHKWAKRIKTSTGRARWGPDQLFALSLKLEYGSAFAVASDKKENIEGAHADHIMYVFDESKAIPDGIFEAAEGAFSASVKGNTKLMAFALAISTPGEPIGKFFDIHARKPGTEDWHATHVTLEEAIAAGRISREWAEQRKAEWGETSSVYRNRVLGEFAAADQDGVIPSLQWVEDAVARWEAQVGIQGVPEGLTAVGCDVARAGIDKTTIARRTEAFVHPIESNSQEDTVVTAHRLKGILEQNPQAYAVVDVIGIGAGVVDQLTSWSLPVIGFAASHRTSLVDVSGELGFTNKRAAMWWTFRELLDPRNEFNLMLPPDDILIGDLLAPKWRMMAGGRIQVESKDDLKKRLGRSPDRADAVLQSFWDPDNEETEEVVTYDERVVTSAY